MQTGAGQENVWQRNATECERKRGAGCCGIAVRCNVPYEVRVCLRRARRTRENVHWSENEGIESVCLEKSRMTWVGRWLVDSGTSAVTNAYRMNKNATTTLGKWPNTTEEGRFRQSSPAFIQHTGTVTGARCKYLGGYYKNPADRLYELFQSKHYCVAMHCYNKICHLTTTLSIWTSCAWSILVASLTSSPLLQIARAGSAR